MKKYNKRKEIIEKEIKVLENVTCDICGKTFECDYQPCFPPVVSFEGHGEYGSGFDGDRISFDICDDCLKKMMEGKSVSFKNIKVECVYGCY